MAGLVATSIERPKPGTLSQEPVVLPHLAATLDLSTCELLRVGGVDVGDAGHVHRHDVGMRWPVPRPLEARQRLVARLGGAVHHRPQLGLGQSGRFFHVDVRDAKDRGQGLEVRSRALVALPSSRKFQPLEKQRVDRDEEART